MKNLKVALAAACAVVVGWAFTASAGYTPVQWIKADGKQWIYTGYTPACTDRVEMKVRFSTVTALQCLYCSRGMAGTTDTFTGFLQANSKIRFDRNTSTSASAQNAVKSQVDYVIVADGNTLDCTVNGQHEATMADGTFTPGSAFSLFASHLQGAALSETTALSSMSYCGSYTLYYFRVSDKDGNLVRNFIPARDDSVSSGTAQYGLFDLVTQSFHPGLGSSSFTAGPSLDGYRWNEGTGKIEMSVSVACAESVGTVAIDDGTGGTSVQKWVNPGAEVSVSATSAEGCRFVRWNGEIDPSLVVEQAVQVSVDRPLSLTAAFARKNEITAWSYVPSGLVVQFDGLVNAGAAQPHGGEATAWADLSGMGRNGAISGSYAWLENGLQINSVSGKGLVTFDATHTAAFTLDVCLKVDNAYGKYARITAENETPAMCCYGGGSSPSAARPRLYGPKDDRDMGTATYDATVLHTSTLLQGGTTADGWDWYHDGALLAHTTCAGTSTGSSTATLANNSGFSRGLDGVYYGVRLYNRALTPQEIALNANIDKVRFGGANPSTLTWPDGYRHSAENGIEARLSVDFLSDFGSVTANGGAIQPGAAFWASLGDTETSVTLVATPADKMSFSGWEGLPAGIDATQATVVVPLGSVVSAKAVFGPPTAYVETTGSQGFVTDILAGPGTRVELDAVITSNATTQREARFFGADAATDDDPLGFSFSMYHTDADKIGVAAKDGAGNWLVSPTLIKDVLDRRLLLTLDVYCDNFPMVVYKTDDRITGQPIRRAAFKTSCTKTATRPLGIAFDNGADGATSGAAMKIHSLKAYESNDLVRCYVPYWDDGKTVIGFKELFTGAIVENALGGLVTAGGEMPADPNAYLPDDYRYNATAGRVEVAVSAVANDATLGTVAATGVTDGWATAGAAVTLTATAAEGCVFRRWEGDLGDADPSAATIALTARRGLSVKAVFGTKAQAGASHADYVQDGLVICYDGADNTDPSKLVNLGSAGASFDLSPVTAGKDKVADGWIRTETGWTMAAALGTAVTGDGYTVEYYGKQTGNGDTAAGYYFAVTTSVKDKSSTGNENIPIGIATKGYATTDMMVTGLSTTWSGSSIKPRGTQFASAGATRTATVDASGSRTIAYYENAVQILSTAKTAGTVNYGIKRVNLGDLRANRGCYWIGDIGSVRIYNRVLTPAEIASNAAVDAIRFVSGGAAGETSYDPDTGKLSMRADYTAAVGGTVLLDGEELTQATSWVESGEHVLTPVADEGYVFSHWAADLPGEPDADDPSVYNLLPGTYDIRPVFRKASDKVFQLTAADYVQDGLLYLYDATENYRPMVHVSNTSVWHDRCSLKTYSLNNGAYFDTKRYNICQWSSAGTIPLDDATRYNNAVKAGVYTMEACYALESISGPNAWGGASMCGIFEWEQDGAYLSASGGNTMKVAFSNAKAASGDSLSATTATYAMNTLSAVGFGTGGVMYTNGVWTSRIAGFTQPYAGNIQRRVNSSYWGGQGINGAYLRIAAYDRALAPAEVLHNATVDSVRYRGDERVRWQVMSTPRPEEQACNYGTPVPAYGSGCAAYGETMTFRMDGLAHYDLDGVVAVDVGEGLRAALKGYVVSNAFGVVAEDASPSATSVTVAMTNLGTSVCWRFCDQALLTLAAPPVGGKVQVYSLETGDPLTELGVTEEIWLDTPARVGIRAVPDEGFKFANWSGATAVMDDPGRIETGITIAGPQTASPVFVSLHHDPCAVFWKEGLESGNWNDGNSWASGEVPADGDWLVIPGNRAHPIDIVLDAKTAQLKSLVIEDGDEPVTITCKGWLTSISATNMVIGRNVTLTCPGGFTNDEMSNRVWVVASTLELREGSAVDVTGGGYGPAQGPGFVAADTVAESNKRGGSHAGRQGYGRSYWQTPAPGAPYGDPAYPTAPGTGSGTANGGGAVLLQADSIVMNGAISADGAQGNAPGSGGSVLLDATTVAGHGTISASSASSKPTDVGYGGGSGGRIAVRYDAAAEDAVADFALVCTARGAEKAENKMTRSIVSGDMGTVWMSDARRYLQNAPTMRFVGKLLARDWTAWTVAGDLAVTDQLGFADGFALTVAGDLSVQGDHMFGKRLEFSGAKLSVGGSVLVKGAGLRLLDGTCATVAGDLTEESVGASYMSQGADLWLQAAPTNGVAAATPAKDARHTLTNGVTATLDVGGAWTMGANTYYLPFASCENGAVVRATARKFVMDAAATVDATHGGWLPGMGLGSAVAHNHGASYGGKGLNASNGVFGDKKRPVFPGGPCNSTWEGAGLVWIEVNKMSAHGTIAAGGHAGTQWVCPAAGGGILLKAYNMDLTGATLDANAGKVTTGYDEVSGGGRIAIWSSDLVTNAQTRISASATEDTFNNPPHKAEDGTIYYGTLGGFRIFVR